MLLPPVPQIPRPLLELQMCRLHLDRDEPLRTLLNNLPGDVGEFLDQIITRPEDMHCLPEEPVERLVGRVWQPLRRKDAKQLVIEVPRDRFDEGECSPDWVRWELEFPVDVAEDENEGFLDLV
jgi:hypothetical protein